MQKRIKVRMHYPEDPQVVGQLETRAARAFARALVSELHPKQIDELLSILKQKQTSVS